MDLQTGHLGDRYHARIILLLLFTMKFLSQFFQKYVCFLRSGVQKPGDFGEICSLISGVLQGFVKICRRYMKVNHF